MLIDPDFTTHPAFEVQLPDSQRSPFVFNSPHSGRHYPQRFLAMTRLDALSVRRSEDFFVDQLFQDARALGAPMLMAHFPRAYLDVNREPYELDPRMFSDRLPPFANRQSIRVAGGLGTVPRVVSEGQHIYARRIAFEEARQRIDAIYKPYHTALRGLLANTHRRFGHAVLIDCHSMPASISIGADGLRPDFVVGDRFGTSAGRDITEAAVSALRSMGYLVALNKPYAGGFITEHYGRPAKGLHAIQIEVNRGLYVNESTLQKKPGFAGLREDLYLFMNTLMGLPDRCFEDYSIAAEQPSTLQPCRDVSHLGMRALPTIYQGKKRPHSNERGQSLGRKRPRRARQNQSAKATVILQCTIVKPERRIFAATANKREAK